MKCRSSLSGPAPVFPLLMTLLVACIFLSACASSTPVLPKDQGKGPRFVLDLQPGPRYRATTRWFLFDLPVYPQVAAWVETPQGEYQGTFFVTAKAERQAWVSAPREGRPEALPVWNHLKQGELDAVAAATAEGATLRWSDLAARLPAGEYVIKLETNRSYDYNASFTQANAGVSGQPSVVYAARIFVGDGPSTADFTPIGTGSADGSDGLIRPGLSGIDTALDLFSVLRVSYRE